MSTSGRLFASVASLCLSISCATDLGTQGATGPAGPAGSSPGSSPDCPDGYTRDTTQMGIIVCIQGMDEIVKVGKKGSAFWIDRYEASVWANEDGTGNQYGAMIQDYPQSFPSNGQVTAPLYALSKRNVTPSRFITWFQASEACRANGKRLPIGDEWLAAARGTLDPGDNVGGGGACVTKGTGPRNTGGGSKCTSDWGAQDMIGNLAEWTADWSTTGRATSIIAMWPDPSYNGDITYTQAPPTSDNKSTTVDGLPTAWNRGGDWTVGVSAGTFLLSLSMAPSGSLLVLGFRCVIPR